MLKVATALEMQHIDRTTIEKYGVAGIVLMERAGLSVVNKIHEVIFESTERHDKHWKGEGRAQRTDTTRKVLVLCGGGNNGGDGFVIARILHNQGTEVEVCLTVKPGSLKGDARINYDAARKFGVKMRPAQYFLSHSPTSASRNLLIVDALLGTGLSKEVRAPLSQVIGKVNRMSCPVVSVDIPSGISSDTGQIMGCAVKAGYTVTFGLPKRGHLLYPGAEYAGQLFIEDIGFPEALLVTEKIRIHVIQKEDVVPVLPERPEYSHKGTYGHVLIVAGSKGKTGAALMAAQACLRTGAGLVTIGIPDTLVDSFQSRVTEEMLLPLPDKGNGTLSTDAADEIFHFIKKRGNVLAIGPGLSADEEISDLVGLLIRESKAPIVIDADGLNAVAKNTGVFKKRKAPTILTPHAGEMVRLLKKGSWPGGQQAGGNTDINLLEQVEKDRINIAQRFAKKSNSFLVLKGVPTVTALPDGRVFINSTGNAGMATAGTGDVLTGMISALLAQGLSPLDATTSGVYMHGLIGDIAADIKGKQSLIASDIINSIPEVFKSIWSK